MSEKTSEFVERLRRDWSGPMSEAEVAFLRDLQGFIEFAARNGLSFPIVMSVLMHDMNEIARDGFDYHKAQSRGFVPKVSGYSKLTSDDFGASEEPEPAE